MQRPKSQVLQRSKNVFCLGLAWHFCTVFKTRVEIKTSYESTGLLQSFVVSLPMYLECLWWL